MNKRELYHNDDEDDEDEEDEEDDDDDGYVRESWYEWEERVRSIFWNKIDDENPIKIIMDSWVDVRSRV